VIVPEEGKISASEETSQLDNSFLKRRSGLQEGLILAVQIMKMKSSIDYNRGRYLPRFDGPQTAIHGSEKRKNKEIDTGASSWTHVRRKG